jgi:hypothetical protein
MSDEQYSVKKHHVKLMDQRPTKRSEGKARLAQRALSNAAVERKLAQHAGKNAAVQLAEAERLESFAAELMKPAGAPTVRSGEVAFAPGGSGPSRVIADTLAHPDTAALEASVARTDLFLSAPADIVALAVDAAASAKANNSLEKMLAHQLALIHTLAMKTGARALEFEKRHGERGDGFKEADSVELSRQSQAISRLSLAFQGGLLVLQRLKNGGSQTVTVRHVTVQRGAQAVIGNVNGGGRRASKVPRRGKPQ